MESYKKESIRDGYLAYMKNPETGEDKLLKCLVNYHETWTQVRSKEYDRIWRQNIAFYSGNHFVRDIATNRANQYRVLLRENHTNNIINRMISIFIQNLPIVRVFPNSIEWEDIKDAENTEQYVKYYWRIKKMEQKFAKLLKYTSIFGNGFIFRRWNPDIGGKIKLSAAESESGENEIKDYKGDVDLCIDDPFKIAVRPGLDELDDMYDIIRSEPVSRSDLESKYGKIEAETAILQNITTGDYREDGEVVIQHHYYHKPTAWFPEGMYACWAGKKILKVSPYPYNDDLLPVNHLPFDKPPLKFWGIATIEQIMDLQEQVNRAASMIIEARNLIARPRVLASNEAKVPAQSLSDRPGEIIRFAMAGGAPRFEVPNFNFGELANHKADVRNAMAQVSGITSASRGEIPQAARTALALQLVLEQDRSQYLPFIKAFHQTILDTTSGLLGIAAEFIDETDPRIIKVEGATNGTKTFHGGMVPSPLDIDLEDTNPIGWTAAGRVESVLDLVKSGLITDPNKALEMIHLKSTDPAYDFININRKTQQREFEDLNKGDFVEIGPEDDDKIHLEEITKIMASYEFKQRPDPVRAAYIDHCNKHKQRYAAMTGQGQQMPNNEPKPVTGGINPQEGSKLLQSIEPGGNIEQLLKSSRAG